MKPITMEEVIKLVNDSRREGIREGIREGAKAMREACAAYLGRRANAALMDDLPLSGERCEWLQYAAEELIDLPLPGDEPGKPPAIDPLRDAIIRAHGMATAAYIQSDQEMRRRIGNLLERTIDADDAMRGFLGRGGPRADLNPLARPAPAPEVGPCVVDGYEVQPVSVAGILAAPLPGDEPGKEPT